MTFYSTISHQTLEIIRSDIIQGALEPGSKLNEQELATRYHVSRTPLREAIRQLQVEGLVEVTVNKGARVAHLSISDIKEYLEVRRVIEGYAIRLVCQTISENDILRLKKIVAAMKDNYYTANHIDNFKLLLEYRTVLYSHCTNTHLRKTLEILSHKFNPLRFILLQTKGVIKLFEMYDALIQLLERREAVEAEKFVTEMLKTYQEIIFEEVLKNHPKLVTNTY